MDDTIAITLPVSNKKVEVRNYTNRKDDRLAEQILYAGVDADATGNFKFPVNNVMQMNEVYVSRMLTSVDGDTNRATIEKFLDDIHSKDYEAIESKVLEVVEEHSPKAQEVLNASKNDTNKK